ncbi:MAG: nuclear transport factor 2 family protein, partial [Nitrospiraceae bacterium]
VRTMSNSASRSQGLAFYRSIGTKAMKIDSLTITLLDDCHWMAKVHWKAFYRKKDGREELVDFDVIYLVQIIDATPKIFAYITGDEQKVLKERGLIPQ